MTSPEERTHNQLLEEARARLAAQLGGQWAIYKEVVAPETITVEPIRIVSQHQLREEQAQSVQALVELGMLAADASEVHRPYFVQ